MIFLNGSRYGSQIEAKKRPTAVSLVLGTHDIKIYMIRANEYIVINKLAFSFLQIHTDDDSIHARQSKQIHLPVLRSLLYLPSLSPFHIKKAVSVKSLLLSHHILMISSTGQWSEPMTSADMLASSICSLRLSETTK